MSSFYLAPSLVQLRLEIEQRFPKRDHAYDGWIGDTSHAARVSDHNPDWSSRPPGIVRAIDTDIEDNDPTIDFRRFILNNVIGDPRVWYAISNGVIYSRTHGWQALEYTGSNGHFHHVHVSILHTDAAANDKTIWFAPKVRVKPRNVDVSVVRDIFKAYVDHQIIAPKTRSLKLVQRALDVDTDGVIGPVTLKAWAKFEASGGGLGRNKIPDRLSLTRLAKGHFSLVA